MDNQRLILLLVFVFSVMMLWESWQQQGQPPVSVNHAAQTGKAAEQPLNEVPEPSKAGLSAPAVPEASALAEETASAAATIEKRTIHTDLYVAEISSQGGDLVRLELLKHAATEDAKQKFVLFDDGARHVYQAQSGLIGNDLPNHKTLYQFVGDKFELADGQDQLVVTLTATSSAGLKVNKIYTFKRGSYLIDVSHELVNSSADALPLQAYFHTLRDDKPVEGNQNNFMMGVHVYTGPAVYTEEKKYQKVGFEDIAKNKAEFVHHANDGWLAMVQHYFVTAWIPQQGSPRDYYMEKLGSQLYRIGIKLPAQTVAPQTTGKVSVQLYAGPQEQDKLASVAPGFDLVVDYGMLTVIAAPLFWVLEWCYKLVGNWGWAIILLTVVLKLLFFPLSATSYKSMARMKNVAPKLAKLKETHGDDKERLNREMMELYKREQINPLGGCLPILVQIPVFIALYWVLLGSVEMRNAPFIGYITDLSVKDPYFILPIVMGLTMVLQTRLNPAPPDPMQAKLMMLMPIMFTGMFLFFPSGLVLYWIVNNVLSIAQQWQINRAIESPGK